MTTHRPPPGSALALSRAAEDGVRNAVKKAAREAGLPDINWCLNDFDERSYPGGGARGWEIHGSPRTLERLDITGDEARAAVEAYALSFGTEVTEEDGRAETVAYPEPGIRVSVWAFTDQDLWNRSSKERRARWAAEWAARPQSKETEA